MAPSTGPRPIFVTLSALHVFLTIQIRTSVILAHMQHDFRCSHVPPAPEPVTHIWLDSANFAPAETSPPPSVTPIAGDHQMENQPPVSDELERAARFRRYIDSKGNRKPTKSPKKAAGANSSSDSLESDSWPLERALETLVHCHRFKSASQRSATGTRDFSPGDLVVSKIQVYYDSSVDQLDKKRSKSIKEIVTPMERSSSTSSIPTVAHVIRSSLKWELARANQSGREHFCRPINLCSWSSWSYSIPSLRSPTENRAADDRCAGFEVYYADFHNQLEVLRRAVRRLYQWPRGDYAFDCTTGLVKLLWYMLLTVSATCWA